MSEKQIRLGAKGAEKIISWQEYSKHITPQDCWVLIGGYVFDVSDYLVEHPGGDDILLKYSGIDATQPFTQQQHSPYALSLRDARKVGKIQTPIYTEQYRLMLQQKKKNLRKPREIRNTSIKPRQNISLEEVSQHNSQKSCWIIIDNKIYDVTNYMESHPGGQGLILDKAGKDASQAFNEAKHSTDAIQKRDKLFIGTLIKKPQKTSNLVVIVFTLVCLSIAVWFLAGYLRQ